jgi:hypothetical protein
VAERHGRDRPDVASFEWRQTWLDPQRRQNRAVADRGRPQLTQACTLEPAFATTSRLEAAHIASALVAANGVLAPAGRPDG